MSARLSNFPAGISDVEALRLVPVSAAAAWRHCGGPVQTRFAWDGPASSPRGPRSVLLHVPDGPRHFAAMWRRLVVREVVARSSLFASLPPDLVRRIVREAE